MAKEPFSIGPILSFRGLVGDRWCVTALIGLPQASSPPVFQLEGDPCPPPRLLLTHKKHQYWRYDLSCELQQHERKLSFGLEPVQSLAS